MAEEVINYVKNVKGYLMINWKTGNTKFLKRLPKSINPQFVPVGINIDVVVPKLRLAEVKGEIKINREQVSAELLDQL